MHSFRKIVAATLLATATLPLIAPPSEAATVRRHLHCSIGATINLPALLGPAISSTPFIVTNQWSFDIPKNTTYTLRVGNKSWTVKNKNALGAGQSFATNTSYTSGACDVSVPG
ncbi:MAG TPA: hypothetical protein VHA70_05200 [Bauldia sp.]|nr:hypothetical protein [Bauldia sp.]